MQATLSERAIQEYREAFALFDKDKDGYISAEELATVMRSMGHSPTPADMRELIGDSNGSYTQRGGKIDFQHFCQLMAQKMKDVDSEQELRDAFRVLDANNNGYIKTAELQKVCANLGEELDESELYDMVLEAISNFDGKIYYDGFKKIMIAH
eukprot:CAMPEP_0183342814 /NCGR_PEP_ID=MMETSP0164_2-20130417/8859_1 /TAXON_ID=221442 /ORGANISM="Coccolithus pelagicus ssp braarudi, Strain PLY182g" /LENGTH=152 /DNA_ID=CAMNT_0025513511 /DNA_START=10 /DNA_END=468 /DNA_ORIENTATION=-